MRTILAAIFVAGLGGAALAQETAPQGQNRIDVIRPDAPELSRHGDLPIGVRTIEVTNPDQVDIVNMSGGGEPRYDRALTLEIWYPAADGTGSEGTYRAFLRDGETEVTLTGRGVRDAQPAADGPYPLIIVSHGYPGNRFLMSHLAENLATKGYVVAAIDHRDSTYNDQAAFGSTLVNRSLDQLFVLDEMERLSSEDGDFLSGLVDTDDTGLIGYSMGGYGAVITAGAGVSEAAVGYPNLSRPARSQSIRPGRTSWQSVQTSGSRPSSPLRHGAASVASGTQRAWKASPRRSSTWPAP